MQMKFMSTYVQVNNIDISLTTTKIVKIFSETNIFGVWAGTDKWHVTGITRFTWYGINIRITTDKTFKPSNRGISWSSSISGAKSFCSSPTLPKSALLGTTKFPLKFSMSFTKSRRFRLIMELRSMLAICLSFTESCRFRVFMECHLRSTSALLGAERLGHSQGNRPLALLWKHKVLCQPCWSLTLCGLSSDSMDSINEYAGDVDLEIATFLLTLWSLSLVSQKAPRRSQRSSRWSKTAHGNFMNDQRYFWLRRRWIIFSQFMTLQYLVWISGKIADWQHLTRWTDLIPD